VRTKLGINFRQNLFHSFPFLFLPLSQFGYFTTGNVISADTIAVKIDRMIKESEKVLPAENKYFPNMGETNQNPFVRFWK
jgi:hypothetical protein